jgi:RNA polymerase sigma factor (TIGR02999 family)
LRVNPITQILAAVQRGERAAAQELLPLVYDELRALAAQRLAREKPGQTLQATALVHEAYLKLIEHDDADHAASRAAVRWAGRGHFFAAAAEAMRRLLIDQARHKRSLKAGGDRVRIDLADVEPAVEARGIDLLALDEALEKLARRDPRKAELVKLRFFTGLSNADAADALGISPSTADNDWAYARAWLRLEMEGAPDARPPAS